MSKATKQSETKNTPLVPKNQPSDKSEAPKETTKKKIEPWTVKELNSKFKPLYELYDSLTNLHTLPNNSVHSEELKQKATEMKDKLDQFKKLYKEAFEQVETKRQTKLKPRFCDIKLTKMLGSHFQRSLPDTGKYGVCDLNRLVPRAISLYVKEKGLASKHFFTLDDALMNIFNSPSVQDPTKTYLDLGRERIEKLRLEPNYEHSTSSADIREDSGVVSMNYSALKIITPKFGVEYEIDETSKDTSKYMYALEEFAKHLEDLHNKQEADKKEANKKKKTKV